MPLSTADFMRHRATLNEACESLMRVKGIDYAQDDVEDNRLNNFERLSVRLGASPKQVLMTYAIKHMDSIEKWIRTGEEGSEPIVTRIQDVRNYIDLLYGIYVAEQEVTRG